VPLFVSGEGGYHTYRIPALAVNARGVVLAFCEGRKTSARDDGDIEPLWLNDKIGQDYRSGVAYSDDGGATWKAGGLVPADGLGLNECTVAELPGEKLLLNICVRASMRAGRGRPANCCTPGPQPTPT
jgi:sialidase-1